MASLKIYIPKGFTLLEAVMVLAIVAAVGTFALGMSFDDYRGDSARTERATLVAVLERARSQAMSNTCLGTGCTEGQPHGVHFTPNSYILFQGPHFTTDDEANEQIAHVTKSIIVTGGDVVFSQLSATTTPEVITITDPTGRTLTVTVGSEGQIF